jgi:hypothetical protein
MANKISNVSYDQIPHVVINHPDTNPEHQSIMRALFKVLKDKHECIYSNEALSKECRIPLRTVERRISELKKMMLITSVGTSYNRRISLGILFNTTASMADKNSTPPPKSTFQTAKSDVSDRHGGGYNKPSTNPSTKESLSSQLQKPTQMDLQEYAAGVKGFEWVGECLNGSMKKKD